MIDHSFLLLSLSRSSIRVAPSSTVAEKISPSTTNEVGLYGLKKAMANAATAQTIINNIIADALIKSVGLQKTPEAFASGACM